MAVKHFFISAIDHRTIGPRTAAASAERLLVGQLQQGRGGPALAHGKVKGFWERPAGGWAGAWSGTAYLCPPTCCPAVTVRSVGRGCTQVGRLTAQSPNLQRTGLLRPPPAEQADLVSNSLSSDPPGYRLSTTSPLTANDENYASQRNPPTASIVLCFGLFVKEGGKGPNAAVWTPILAERLRYGATVLFGNGDLPAAYRALGIFEDASGRKDPPKEAACAHGEHRLSQNGLGIAAKGRAEQVKVASIMGQRLERRTTQALPRGRESHQPGRSAG